MRDMFHRMRVVKIGGLALVATLFCQARPFGIRSMALAMFAQAARQDDFMKVEGRELLDRYCIVCHNQKLRVAGLTLEGVDLDRIGADSAVWEKVVQKLRGSAMPPAGRV